MRMSMGKRPLFFVFLLLLALSGLAGCQAAVPGKEPSSSGVAPTVSTLLETQPTAALANIDEVETAVATPTADAPATIDGPTTISIDTTAAPQPIDRHVLGTNLPAWLGTSRTEDETFIARTIASGVTLIRIPGGSWSNGYNWLACETGADISGDTEACRSWPWGLRPTDFINFIRATGTEAMYTVNLNGTAKEAAALVAFFNGSVDDDREIGVDVRGGDWGKVSDWAQLRSDQGNPDPLPIRYWEIGNEIYGGKTGKDCASWGWENVWTCDGREYVNGIGQGEDRHEGFLTFRAAMQEVDPTIQVGAVGVPAQTDWNDWGLEVIEEAASALDFYIIHQYAYFEPPQSYAEMLVQPQTAWQPLIAEVSETFAAVGNGRMPPIAITEYNLFSVQEQDTQQLMKQAANMLFLADTIGQMLQRGVSLANQWNLANGEAGNGTDYGLLHADTYYRYPQYYAFPLWSKFGDQMLPVTTNLPADSTLSLYAGRVDAQTVSLLVINKSDTAVTSEVQLSGLEADTVTVLADVVQAPSLDSEKVAFNGITEPADDLSDSPSLSFSGSSDTLPYTFTPYSITLLQIKTNE